MGDNSSNKEIRKRLKQVLSQDYVIPDPAFVEVLKQKNIQAPPKICFTIIAHDWEDVLADQVANLRKYNPGAQVVVYNGGINPEFGKSVGVDICPFSRPLHASYKLGPVMIDVMRWLEAAGSDYEYLINIDSDCLFVNPGFGSWLESTMRGFDLMGMFLRKYHSPDDAKGWLPGESMWKEWHRWQSFFQTDYFMGTLNSMQVYRRGIVRRMLDTLDLDQFEQLTRITDVYALEEILTSTLAVRCGASYRPYPLEATEFMRLEKPFEVSDVMAARKRQCVFFMHPIERNMKNPSRQFIRVLDGGMSKLMESKNYLNSRRLMDKVIEALDRRKPFSVVGVGATETLVLAQYTVMTEEEFMNHDEAVVANWEARDGFYHRGIRFPNKKARDLAVQAVRNADIVGLNTIVQTMDGGLMTEKVFHTYGINPKFVFEAYVRRVLMFSQRERFKKMLSGRKILLVGSKADEAREGLNKKWKRKLGFKVVGAIPIWSFEEIEAVKNQIDKCKFDLCLLAAGTNALILADYVKRKHRKVAFDIGRCMESFITGEIVEDDWLRDIIRIKNLLKL